MNCEFKKKGKLFTCSNCNHKQKRLTKRNCHVEVMPKPQLTKEQRLQIVALHCWSCDVASSRDGTKSLKSINCPKSCGCSSTKAEPVVLRLMDHRFGCWAGRF